MPISAEHVGRQYPPTAPYEVSHAKISEFAAALGNADPRHTGPDAVAPPTFVAVLSAPAWQLMFDDPELDLALPRIVHGDQRFEFARLLRAGDRVRATLTIEKVRTRGAADIISASVAVRTAADPCGSSATGQGELVCTATATFFHSREAAT